MVNDERMEGLVRREGELRVAMGMRGEDAGAMGELGEVVYELGRREEGIGYWERAVRVDKGMGRAWRCLGVGYFNVYRDVAAAKGAYVRARKLSPGDGQLLFERDVMARLLGEVPEVRRAGMEEEMEVVKGHLGLTAAYGGILNMAEEYEKAIEVLEGVSGEGEMGEWVMDVWVTARIGQGRMTLWRGDAAGALGSFGRVEGKMSGEVVRRRRGELWYWQGMACRKVDGGGERELLMAAAGAEGEFVEGCAEGKFFAGMALRELGKFSEAEKVFEGLLAYGAAILGREAATVRRGLWEVVPLEGDGEKEREVKGRFVEALGRYGVLEKKEARKMLGDVLRDDPNCGRASDFVTALEW